MNKHKIKYCAVTVIVGLIAMVIFDLYNIPCKLGINAKNLNMDIQTLVVSNVVVIGLFVITYFLIDKRNIEKENRQKECAILFIKETAKHCEGIVKSLDDRNILYAAVKKCDFNALYKDDKVFYSIYTTPFGYENLVFDAANNGYISQNTLKNYLDLKSTYQSYINVRISFFDAEDIGRIDLCSYISTLKNDLKTAITNCENI